jgi:hypothetical protein
MPGCAFIPHWVNRYHPGGTHALLGCQPWRDNNALLLGWDIPAGVAGFLGRSDVGSAKGVKDRGIEACLWIAGAFDRPVPVHFHKLASYALRLP